MVTLRPLNSRRRKSSSTSSRGVGQTVRSKDTQTILSQLEKEDFFTFLGAYSEVS